MKKVVRITLILLIMAICVATLCACDSGNDGPKDWGDVMTLALGRDYSLLNIAMQTASGDLKLTSSYALSKEANSLKVVYSIQQANPFVNNNGNIEPPTEKISTYTGTATVVNGIVTNDPVGKLNIAPQSADLKGMKVNKSYFDNVVDLTDSSVANVFSYTADVVDPVAFMGIQASDMKMSLQYNNEYANEQTILNVSYTDAQGCSVKISFTARTAA